MKYIDLPWIASMLSCQRIPISAQKDNAESLTNSQKKKEDTLLKRTKIPTILSLYVVWTDDLKEQLFIVKKINV